LVTTSSVEALKLFREGEQLSSDARYGQAIKVLRRATDLDPEFAIAHSLLANALGNAGERTASREAYQRSIALKARISTRERMKVEARYQFQLDRDLESALTSEERFVAIYPEETTSWGVIAQIYRRLGQPDRAVEPARTALRANKSVVAAFHLVMALRAIGRFDEAKAEIDTRKLDNPDLLATRFAIAVVQGDADAKRRMIALAEADPKRRHLALGWQAREAAFEGRAREARKWTGEAVEVATAGGYPSDGFLAESAFREAAFESCATAREAARQAPNSVEASVAAGWCGDRQSAADREAELIREYPLGTIEKNVYVPTLRAAVDLTRDPERAVSQLGAARPLERSNYAEFKPQYLRGLALLRLKRPDAAAAEFQRILDNRGDDPLSPLYPLAYVGLAEAATMAGNTAKARQAYNEFFKLWEHADPDVPILLRARRAFDALK
jgi:tetratricopeptide (TPR) repeat protein